MADAAAHIARDAALLDEAARVPNGLADARLAQSPWQVLARAGDGRPLASAAASQGTLVLTMTSRAGDLAIPTMLRAIAGSLAPDEDPAAAEILPIPESQLNAWSRAPGPAPRPRPENVERDDRRWLWGSVLVLLGIEVWLRRSRRDAAETIEETRARVA
jgi:hypothetical protein